MFQLIEKIYNCCTFHVCIKPWSAAQTFTTQTHAKSSTSHGKELFAIELVVVTVAGVTTQILRRFIFSCTYLLLYSCLFKYYSILPIIPPHSLILIIIIVVSLLLLLFLMKQLEQAFRYIRVLFSVFSLWTLILYNRQNGKKSCAIFLLDLFCLSYYFVRWLYLFLSLAFG